MHNIVSAREIAEKIARLDSWESAYPSNWAVKPAGGETFFVSAVKGEVPEIKVRLMLVRGWEAFTKIQLLRRNPAAVLAFTPGDVEHDEVIYQKDGSITFVSFFPGFVPETADDVTAQGVVKTLWETFGLLMRCEEDPELPGSFASEKAMFCREEYEPGRWRDAPCPIPENPIKFERRISLDNAKIAKAKTLEMRKDAAWEIAFTAIPQLITKDEKPRICYLFAAADAAGGKGVFAQVFSVPPARLPDGLAKIWEHLAQETLDRILAAGFAPSEIHVSDIRLLNMMRPLGMNLPFKMTVKRRTPAVDAYIDALRETRFKAIQGIVGAEEEK